MMKQRWMIVLLVFVFSMLGITNVFGAVTYDSGVTTLNSTSIKLWFQPGDWKANYVIVHYQIASGTQQNTSTSYNSTTKRWEYTLTGVTSNQSIRYSFTYNINGLQYDSSSKNYTVGSQASGLVGSYMYNRLVWSDEFTGSNLNRNNWNYQIGNGYNLGASRFDGWGNGEWEWYRQSNVSVSNGNLVIKGEYSSTPTVIAGRQWYQFSGRVTTKGLKSWKYARVEARIKMPTVYATWPAFWLLGDTCDATVNGGSRGYDTLPTNWPSCGEIDIMEHKNSDTQICSNLFWDNRKGLNKWSGDVVVNNPTWTSGVDVSQYHVYGMEWNQSTLNYYLDGRLIKTEKISAWNQDEFHNQNWHILFNMAISGTLTGNASPIIKDFPCYMYVDYVRVYQ